MTEKVYGYILVNKETGEQAQGTKSRVFETRNAAGAGFYQWTCRGFNLHLPESIRNKKLSEQDVYEIKELVIKK